jgi:hypothetical protein
VRWYLFSSAGLTRAVRSQAVHMASIDVDFLDATFPLLEDCCLDAECHDGDLDFMGLLGFDSLPAPVSLPFLEPETHSGCDSPGAGSSASEQGEFHQPPFSDHTSQSEAVADVAKPVVTTGFQSVDPAQASGSKSDAWHETSSSQDDSDNGQQQSRQVATAGSKRKLPVVDWRSIPDVEERRKQRRLQKNRVTAARSRERKKEQWSELEARFKQLQAENSRIRGDLEVAKAANAQLTQQLASLTRGTSSPLTGHDSEPAVLLYLATVHLTCDACEKVMMLFKAMRFVCLPSNPLDLGVFYDHPSLFESVPKLVTKSFRQKLVIDLVRCWHGWRHATPMRWRVAGQFVSGVSIAVGCLLVLLHYVTTVCGGTARVLRYSLYSGTGYCCCMPVHTCYEHYGDVLPGDRSNN